MRMIRVSFFRPFDVKVWFHRVAPIPANCHAFWQATNTIRQYRGQRLLRPRDLKGGWFFHWCGILIRYADW